MAEQFTLEYAAPPAFGGLYRSIFLTLVLRRKGVKPGEALPAATSSVASMQADPQRLQAYNEACAFPEGDYMPITYPFVLSMPLQMGIFADKRFPLSAVGFVHTRQHILQHRPLKNDEPFSCTCAIAGQRVVKAGLEFDVVTEIEAQGALAWEGISTYLVRGKKWGKPGEPAALAQMPDLTEGADIEDWRVDADMGRRYAKITGDYNPIHVSKFMAKVFGFKRDIVHGAWTMARCMAALPPLEGEGIERIDMAFKGPVFMGSSVKLKGALDTTEQRFDLFCGKNPRPVLQGRHTLETNQSRLF